MIPYPPLVTMAFIVAAAAAITLPGAWVYLAFIPLATVMIYTAGRVFRRGWDAGTAAAARLDWSQVPIWLADPADLAAGSMDSAAERAWRRRYQIPPGLPITGWSSGASWEPPDGHGGDGGQMPTGTPGGPVALPRAPLDGPPRPPWEAPWGLHAFGGCGPECPWCLLEACERLATHADLDEFSLALAHRAQLDAQAADAADYIARVVERADRYRTIIRGYVQ